VLQAAAFNWQDADNYDAQALKGTATVTIHIAAPATAGAGCPRIILI
jgi:hypothetical protein